MMKLILGGILLFSVAATTKTCGKQATAGCYKGRLEVKGICANYTIKVLDAKGLDWTEAAWTDEQTRKNYTEVFKLANPCNFPNSLKEGDEFYFTLDTGKMEPCTTCMAFYPTPTKAAAIKVLPNACP
jgi:hypothetical protein